MFSRGIHFGKYLSDVIPALSKAHIELKKFSKSSLLNKPLFLNPDYI
jgi:hypothetical protein